MPLLSIVAGVFNEEENVREFYRRLTQTMARELPEYDYEVIIADNASTDRSLEILREICREDRRIRVIVNNRNFGHIRSGANALTHTRGDATVAMASDLEDPPEMIPQFVRRWEEGYKIVLAQKRASEEKGLFYFIRKLYYKLMDHLSDTPMVQNATGFGIYDRQVMDDIRKIGDPYPYLRGLICDLGYSRYLIPFDKPVRKRGITKNNFYTLYDLAMLGITGYSKIPLRLATFAGFCIGALSFLVAVGYLVYKLIYWGRFEVGMAPVVFGIFFLGSVQLFFIGILGEYIGSIHTQVLRRPPVIERERINFEEPAPAVMPAVVSNARRSA